jgi:hypothetical protein
MSSVTEASRAIARVAAVAFGGRPEVNRYYDEAETHCIDIMSSAHRPTGGLTTYSTLGLHMTPNLLEAQDVRVELAGVAPTSSSEFANALATAAFFVVKDHWLCAPGVVFPALLQDYGLSSTLPHVMWVTPFPWEELAAVDIGRSLTVHWLLAVPISEAERQLLVDRGYRVLEEEFAAREIEYFDLDRPSVI